MRHHSNIVILSEAKDLNFTFIANFQSGSQLQRNQEFLFLTEI